MSVVSATQFGSHVRFTNYGEYATANDGDGMLKGEALIGYDQDIYPVSHAEVLELARHAAVKDIEHGNITYPPSVELTLGLSSDFYNTYLCDSGYDRIEATDRYVAMVVDLLDEKQNEGAPVRGFSNEKQIRAYVESAHERALELTQV